MQHYVKLARPQQWVKNVLIFTVPILNLEALNQSLGLNVLKLFLAFLSFALVAGGVYAFNDASDAHLDALHPTKKHRPIPSGYVKRKNAYTFSFVLFLVGSLLLWGLGGVNAFAVTLAYILINIFYSLWFKQTAGVEILMVAAGYPVRIAIGAFVINAYLTWYFMTLFALFALTLVMAKRLAQKLSGNATREVLKHYTVTGLKTGIVVSSVGAWLCFVLWILEGRLVFHDSVLISSVLALIVSGGFFGLVAREASTGLLEKPESIVKRPAIIIVAGALFVVTMITLLTVGG
jgi:decaprenyl-phosphate phosphoribosyltransferase